MSLNRREFLEAAAAGSVVGPLVAAKPGMVGIQVGAISFVDEGIEQVLDILQQRAHVNTIFLAVFTYGRGIAGRQVPGQPLPDHGKQEYDLNFHGGNYAHPRIRSFTAIPCSSRPGRPTTAIWTSWRWSCRRQRSAASGPSAGSKTSGVAMCRASRSSGNRPVRAAAEHALFQQSGPPGFLHGTGGRLHSILRNRRDHVGLRAPWSARQCARARVTADRRQDPGRVGCFCRFCEQKARAARHPFRAREGRATGTGEVRPRRAVSASRPVDGYYVTFLRLLLRYPGNPGLGALLPRQPAGNLCGHVCQGQVRRNRTFQVGWHIWHNNSFSPFYRAEQDLQELLAVLRLPEDGDVSQLRRRTHGSLYR